MEYKELRQAITDMEGSRLDSLEIEFPDGTKISMKKNGKNANTAMSLTNTEPVGADVVSARLRSGAGTRPAPTDHDRT